MTLAEARPDLKEAGAKFDGEKIRWDLVPDDAMEEVAKVYTLGARKYASRNWEKGIEYTRIVGALRRHLNAWVRGEQFDPENGQPHLASVVWNGLALLAYELRGMNGGKYDDRPRVQFYPNVPGSDGAAAEAAPSGTQGPEGTDGTVLDELLRVLAEDLRNCSVELIPGARAAETTAAPDRFPGRSDRQMATERN